MESVNKDDNGVKKFFHDDCISLLEQANLHDKELRHKRRWLVGLPAALNENGELKGSKLRIGRLIPESLLREDDVSYEVIKSFVEESARGCKNKYHDDMQLIYSPRDIKSLLSLIDNMTNQGLQEFAKALTNGSIKFEKTRWKMKKIIKQRLSEVYNRKQKKINLSETQSSLLKNPLNFRWSRESRFIPDSNSSYRAAVYKILNVLEDLPTQTIIAMHRKARGKKESFNSRLKIKKTGWKREKLIESLRKKCSTILSNLKHEGDSLQEPLSKAMEVASLNLKLIQGYHYTPNFLQSSAEINSLQNEIATCIKLLDQRVGISALKDIKAVLDPSAKIAERSLRASVRNLLTEYLFECGDMDNIPQCLLEVITIIKRSSDNCLTEETIVVEEEVECILSLSASMKQVLLDLIPKHRFDLEFAEAYMEDLEDSDADDFELEEENTDNLAEKTGSSWGVGENGVSCSSSNLDDENPPVEICSMKEARRMQYHLVNMRNTEEQKEDTDDCLKDRNDEEEKNGDSSCKNKYVGVQGGSDEVSMVAYRLIGHMLYDFAKIEGCELSSGDTSYLGVGSYGLIGKKRKVAGREKASSRKEDGGAILMKAIKEIIPSHAK